MVDWPDHRLLRGLAIAMAYSMTPYYRASVLLDPVLKIDQSAGGGWQGASPLIGLSLGKGDEATETSVAVLTSREFTESFLREKHLLPVLFPKRWDGEAGRWKTIDGKSSEPTAWEAYSYFDESVRKVVKNANDHLYRLQIEWKDPAVAAEWANDLVIRLNALMREQAISEGQKHLDSLLDLLATTPDVAAKETISRLTEGPILKITMAKTREQYAFEIVDAAIPAKDPIRPKKFMMAFLGLLVGAFLGGLQAVLRAPPPRRG